MLKRSITIVFQLLFLVNSTGFACDLVYDVHNHDDISGLCVTIEKNKDGTTYRSTYRDVRQLYHYDKDNLLTQWEYADKGADTDFKASRNADLITVRGTSNGQPLNTSLTVGDEIWLQNSEFGLLGFLNSKEKSKEFIVVSPEDLSINKVQAIRTASEITWNGQRIKIIELTARLRGFMSLFWKAVYWYRLPEMTFLRYKADGLPGVPEVDIRLVKEKDAR
jgi:hypothetical protein